MTGTLLDRTLGTGALAVTIAGTPVELDQLGAVTIRHGRTKPDAQPEPSTASFTTKAELLPQVGQLVTVDLGPDAVAAFGTAAGASRRFHGRITDAKVTPPPGEGASWRHRVQVVATGELAKLGRQHIGDTPWPAELDGARAARILALATGVTVGPVDSGTVTIRARDVDRQPVLQLLQQLAADADGVVHQRRDGSVVYHDADHRVAASTALELAAAELLWPLRWSQDLAGMVNDLTVGYGTAEPQAEYRFTDQASIDALGETYAAKVATQLDQLADAETFAHLTVARRSRPWWDVDTMAVELLRTVDGGVHDRAAELLALELGDLLQVTGLPERGPLQLGRLWVEGWTETITPSSWQLVLAVSPYGRTGPAARWADVDPATSWAELDPAMSWAGAAGWDPGTGPDDRWTGTPADLTWADLAATTWASWPA